MYADKETRSMHGAMLETARRREIQMQYNEANGIIPKTIVKGIRDVIEVGTTDEKRSKRGKGGEDTDRKLTKTEKEKLIAQLTVEMKDAARRLEFEQAAFLRDQISKIREGTEAPKKRTRR